MWKMNIENVLELHGGLNDFATTFDEEVDRFLMLLKLLPIRAQGRTTAAKRLNFNDTVDKLIVYRKVFSFFKSNWFHRTTNGQNNCCKYYKTHYKLSSLLLFFIAHLSWFPNAIVCTYPKLIFTDRSSLICNYLQAICWIFCFAFVFIFIALTFFQSIRAKSAI